MKLTHLKNTAALCILFASIHAPLHALRIESNAMLDGEKLAMQSVANVFGCQGPNWSPDVRWMDVPQNTKAFAVTLYDPDAPTGSGWWHWTVFNIPSNIHGIQANASAKNTLPKRSIEGTTDFGAPGFGGACPPKGDKPHRYVLTVYALKNNVPLDENASGAMVGFYLNNLAIESASITSFYKR